MTGFVLPPSYVRGNEFYSISQAGEGVQRESELSHGILCCATDLQGKGISSEVSFFSPLCSNMQMP